MRKYRRLIIVGIILGLLAFIAVALLSDVSSLAKYATSFPWWIMILVLGLRVVNWLLRFVKWHFYLGLVGVREISIWDSATVFFSGFPMSASPGKAAEILKSFIIKNLTGTPVASTLPVVAAERLSDGLAVLILFGWSIVNLAAAQYWVVLVPPLALLIVGIIILQFRPLCLALLDRLGRFPVIGRFARNFELLYESSYRIVQLRSLVFAVGLGTGANVLDGVGVFLILVRMGQPPTTETFFQALLAISLSVITGSLSGSPGGIGASDLTITGTLTVFLGDPTKAGFATLLARFVQLWWGVLVGGTVAILARKRLFPPSLEQVIAEEQARPTVAVAPN
jgi:glycosyltransferase 2 family protein